MKKTSIILPIIFTMLMSSCGGEGGGDQPGPGPEPTPTEYSYRCTISWEGYTPHATFSDTKDPSKTSEDIAPLFEEKISQKVLSYPEGETKGVREHSVNYVYIEDPQLTFTSSTTNEEFKNVYVDMNDQKVLDYLRADTLEEQYQALMATKNESHDASHYTLEVSRYGKEGMVVNLATDEDFTIDVTRHVADTGSCTFEYLYPGQTYYWKAISRSTGIEYDGGMFTVREDNIRFGNFDRVGNMRDLGGWKVGDHAKVKYDMLFRGRNVDSLNPAQKEAITENFGFKTQIDLRCDGDSPLNVKICPGVNYYYTNTNQYSYYALKKDEYLNVKAGVCQTPDEDNGKRLTYGELFKKIFKVLADEENYPVYFHCAHGADRTGTLALLIEAVLGISYDDIVRDYELTSFSSKSGQRLRAKGNSSNTSFEEPLVDDSSKSYRFQGLVHVFDSANGETFNDKVVNYLTTVVGVSMNDINSIRNILLEEC